MRPIYLDHNATTPLRPEVWDAMRPYLTETFGNPSSAHAVGRKARQALEDARENVAALLGAFPDEVTFTSGATEANNLAIFGHRPARAVASHLEHPCVIEPLRQLESRGVPVEWLPVDSRGVLRTDALPTCAALVCVMLANHETGVIQPVREIAKALARNASLHCDAAQAVGKIPVDFANLGASTLAASAHKFGGPKGVGVLLTRRGTELAPLTFGGHQQKGRRPGTEPVPLTVGMASALEIAVRDLVKNLVTLANLRARLWDGLQRSCGPVVLNGPEIGAEDVVPTTLNASFPDCRADVLLMALDLAGVACSTGSACSSGSLLPSPVLRAMGTSEEVLRSALRFSLSPNQTAEEIDEAVRRIAGCVARVRQR
ncbi:MAG: cysteine desulfurase [Planctomycetes bacterium]|nr:cysteine desulfurase [Planctomycetota bacterium]